MNKPEPNEYEIELSVMLCCLAELNGEEVERRWWKGYHPDAYGMIKFTEVTINHLAARLHAQLQDHPDPSRLSFELQIWWRDNKDERK